MASRNQIKAIDDGTLARVVAESQTLAEVARRLGVRVDRGRMRDRIAQIDTSHFTHKRHSVDDETLRRIVAESFSYSEIGTRLGIEYSPLPREIRKRVDRLGTLHFKRRDSDRIDDATLGAAVRESRSYAELARRLNVTEVRRELRQRVNALDTAHFIEIAGVSDEEFRKAVRTSWSVEALRITLGYTNGHFDRIRARMRKLGMNEDDFCAPPPRARAGRRVLAPEAVFQKRPREARKQNGDTLRAALLRVGRPYHCATCGLGPTWMGKPLRLQVDHVNGDRLDDRIENLQFLCPNCHTQTPTFCGRNKHGQPRPVPARVLLKVVSSSG